MQQYRVGELTELIRRALAGAFPGNMSVTGEVTEAFRSSNGHFYFSLKDDTGKIKAVYFRQFMRPDSFIPKNGDEVNVIGELKLYAPDGTYQLQVRRVVYSAGGEFWKRFEETRKRLETEGLFEDSRKKPVPVFPRRIALLTAETGAAVRDFIVTARNTGLHYSIDLWPIPVQGKEAAPKIARVIKSAGARTDLYDALVLTRGGGSLEDLAVFNEETVARALAGCAVPTVSAIGHERDTTICDFVADERVATPTAAAERLSRGPSQAALNLSRIEKRLPDLMIWRMENTVRNVETLGGRLRSLGAEKLINNERWRLDSFRARLTGGLKGFVNQRISALHGLDAKLSGFNPLGDIDRRRHRLDTLENFLKTYAQSILQDCLHRLEMAENRLRLTDPERLLSLGYALVTKGGEIVTEAASVSLEEELEIKMKDGYINTFVTGKHIN